MKRRKFLLVTATGALATMMPYCRSRRNDPALRRPLFLAAICDEPTLRQIGTAYRKNNPDESRRSTLSDLLTENLPDDASLANRIGNNIRQDFATGRIVTVDGWVLSLTEARQCAMYSLQ